MRAISDKSSAKPISESRGTKLKCKTPPQKHQGLLQMSLPQPVACRRLPMSTTATCRLTSPSSGKGKMSCSRGAATTTNAHYWQIHRSTTSVPCFKSPYLALAPNCPWHTFPFSRLRIRPQRLIFVRRAPSFWAPTHRRTSCPSAFLLACRKLIGSDQEVRTVVYIQQYFHSTRLQCVSSQRMKCHAIPRCILRNCRRTVTFISCHGNGHCVLPESTCILLRSTRAFCPTPAHKNAIIPKDPGAQTLLRFSHIWRRCTSVSQTVALRLDTIQSKSLPRMTCLNRRHTIPSIYSCLFMVISHLHTNQRITSKLVEYLPVWIPYI